MSRSTRSAWFASACLLGALLAPLGMQPAHATCASGARTVSGTISGIDGRYVNAFIGFDLKTASGASVGLDGCAVGSGYGAHLNVNSDAPATGTTSSGGHTKTWSLRVPTNVTRAFIEVYPKNPAGTTTTTRYTNATRTRVAIPYGSAINLRLAVLCSLGGQTGQLVGYTSTASGRTQATRVSAFSGGPDTNSPGRDASHPVLGFGIATTRSDGYYALPVLASGQEYTVLYTIGGRHVTKYHVRVNRCAATRLDVSG